MRVLTFDIEEWFHILDNPSTKYEHQWLSFESRIHHNLSRIFAILERKNVRATFFCVGWIADKYPELITEIAERGYEVGSHTQMHQLVYEQKPEEFQEDLHRSISTLEDLTGKKVRSFRAPGFSITEQNKWAFEILVKNGIEIDCSIFPGARAHGGFPTFNDGVPSIIRYNGIELKEFPISYSRVLGKPLFYSGGGYFRLCPYQVIKNLTSKSDYVMSYLHPRDFDPNQPMVPDLPISRKIKCYVGLNTTERKLDRWLSDFSFTDLEHANAETDWSKAPVYEL